MAAEARLPPERRRAWLVAVGLSEAEARAYLALLDHGPATASEVASRAGVARNRVYDVLEALAARGLVDIRLEAVRVFSPRGIADHLSDRKAALEREQATLRERRERLRELFGGAPAGNAGGAHGGFRVVRGRREVADALVRLLAGARVRVVAATTLPTAWRLLNHATGCEVLPRLVAGGVEFRLAAGGVDAADPRAAALRAALGTDVSFPAAAPALHRFVVDDGEVALLAVRPDDDRLYVGEDVLVLADAPALVREATGVALAAWTATA